MAELLAGLPGLPDRVSGAGELLLLTLTQAVLRQKGPKMDFGVAPETAEVCGVIRAHQPSELAALKTELAEFVRQVCAREALKRELSWHEAFPATVNQDASVELIREAAEGAGLTVAMLEEPFRWSEDFSIICKGTKTHSLAWGPGSISRSYTMNIMIFRMN